MAQSHESKALRSAKTARLPMEFIIVLRFIWEVIIIKK